MKLDVSRCNEKILTDQYVEKLLASIWFKQVEPLLRSMNENLGVVSFVSEKFCFDSKEIVDRIVKQKKEYYSLVEDLKSFENHPLSAQAQTSIFSIVTRMLGPALQYGYANEAMELLRILRNEKLTGEKSSSDETTEIVSNALDRIVAIYGLRFIKERHEYLKNPVRELINEIRAGKFGEVRNSFSNHFKEILNNPEQILDIKCDIKIPRYISKQCDGQVIIKEEV